jgi:hypothetical protein
VSRQKTLTLVALPPSNRNPTTPAEKQHTPADITDLPPQKSPETKHEVPDIEIPHGNEPIVRKEEVSAEVPKLGVSAESYRASLFEIPNFEKDKA